MMALARTSLRTALVMFGFSVLGTALLALTYGATRDAVRQNELAAELAQIAEVLPQTAYDNDLAKSIVTLPPTPELGTEEATVARAAWHQGQRAGAVFTVVAPDGYSGRIKLLVAVLETPQGPVVGGVRVIAHRETPGLGDYIEPRKDRSERKWIAQFDSPPAGLPAEAWRVKKDGGRFAYRAGATITPRAVVKAVGGALAYYRENQAKFYPAESR
ncbi:Ion-translocating oxidoreductase complex subunit G [Burkholderiales bacterium]|nr:MAG: RnfABCDGE type electron transport complex subunit G [Burkholderiales bacterium]CAG0989642.1 Ion-translocating oxidoreductase complex subunit G [Burkholderiales bacterium]